MNLMAWVFYPLYHPYPLCDLEELTTSEQMDPLLLPFFSGRLGQKGLNLSAELGTDFERRGLRLMAPREGRATGPRSVYM